MIEIRLEKCDLNAEQPMQKQKHEEQQGCSDICDNNVATNKNACGPADQVR